MRAGLLLSLAWADYRGEARLSLCAIFALAAVITPLLVLFGLKYGLVSTLTERLERAPSVREIIPVGGARYRAEDIAALAARADVAFAVPRTRQIAATADLSGGGETALSVEMIPSAAGDPLLAGLPQPDRPTRVVLSHGAAEKLGAQPGERIVARIGRRMDGQAQSQRLELEVLAVLPQERFARDALFAPLALLEAAEDYRDGRAVAAYGWPGKAGETPRARIYPGFRLYARDLDAVEGLRRHFVASGVEVATQAEAIAQVRSLSRNLGLVFWIVAALAIGGAFAAIAASSLAAVERKRRALAVLRLLGFPTAALVGFVMFLALFSAVFGLFLAGLLYAATAGALNHLFDNQSGEFVCRLLPSHYLTALLATLLCSVLAAASRRGITRCLRKPFFRSPSAPAWHLPRRPGPKATRRTIPSRWPTTSPCRCRVAARWSSGMSTYSPKAPSTIARSTSATPSTKARRATSSRSSPATGATT